MEWKVYLLYFALLVVATSAAPTCKCEDEDKETLSKYKVKVKDGDEEYDQEIKIDTEKQTETYHIPKTKSSNAGEVDEVYDFKRNLVMRRMPEHKACFLSESTENAPKPQDLKNALDKKSASAGSSQSVNTTEDNFEVVGTVDDRSTLSDEMAAMCAKFPIYRIKRKKVTLSVEKEKIQGGKDREKRDICYYSYWKCWIITIIDKYGNSKSYLYCRKIYVYYSC